MEYLFCQKDLSTLSWNNMLLERFLMRMPDKDSLSLEDETKNLQGILVYLFWQW